MKYDGITHEEYDHKTQILQPTLKKSRLKISPIGAIIKKHLR